MTPNQKMPASIIRVGDGRGFIVNGQGENKLIVTAGHCLPGMPRPMNFSELGERTYTRLIGPIGKEPMITAECLFVDPISDVAVLGAPDNQELSEECDAYESFVGPLAAFSVVDIPPTPPSHKMPEGERGWVLSLAGEWQECRMSHIGGPLWLSGARIDAGMSGSPILSASGCAVGVVASNHAQPRLAHILPVWVIKAGSNSKRSKIDKKKRGIPANSKPRAKQSSGREAVKALAWGLAAIYGERQKPRKIRMTSARRSKRTNQSSSNS